MTKIRIVEDLGDAHLDEHTVYLMDGSRLTEEVAWQWSDEYEAKTFEERRGRPARGTEPKGDSPRRSLRVPMALDQQMQALARAKGSSVSEVIRKALEAYVQSERASNVGGARSRD